MNKGYIYKNPEYCDNCYLRRNSDFLETDQDGRHFCKICLKYKKEEKKWKDIELKRGKYPAYYFDERKEKPKFPDLYTWKRNLLGGVLRYEQDKIDFRKLTDTLKKDLADVDEHNI
jgi:hypothetical protein